MGQPPATLDADTLEPGTRAASSLAPRAPVLTLALHPELARCGDRAVLANLGPNGIALSRAEPSFLGRDGRSTGPLHDAHVSRAPVRITPHRTGLMLDASEVRGGIEVAGSVVTGRHEISHDALEEGVAIALAGAVLLILRNATTVPASRELHGLVGASDELSEVRAAIDVAARHADPVLLLGESGTGKELVAAAIHRASARAGGPFVSVNAATLAASTAAAELFGHSRGAFTGAEGAHAGYFGRADGGTLFLDEIGDAPPAVQPMLLRALESGEIAPVGGRASRRVDVRVIAATDRDLSRAADDGAFRLPLLHRLATQSIVLAPLRERREDVLPLFVRFLREESPDADAATLPLALARALLDRTWPGNVRELRNAARTLARQGPTALAVSATERPATTSRAPAVREAPHDVSDEALVAALRRNGFRIGATARDLGIARNTLYRRMEGCEGLRRARDLAADEIRAVAAAHPGDLEALAARLEVSARGLRLRMGELGLDALAGDEPT